MQWFDVDRQGLAKILTRKGKEFAIYELLQNAWDAADVSKVEVVLEPVADRPVLSVSVTDDSPGGFKNLSHAFTLFAESEKKGDPTKRGRFNLGEKLVLALCEEAEVISTTGSVLFDKTGRHIKRTRRDTGSQFRALMKINRREYASILESIRRLICPQHVRTYINGVLLNPRSPVQSFEISLPTVLSDEEGYLRPTERKTEVVLFEVQPDETPTLYEMGIPIVEIESKWHIDVQQKVPVNLDRDNVTPRYLQRVYTAVLNHMHSHINSEDASDSWVREALADKNCSKEAVETVITQRFGKKRVIFDPSDPEGTKLATSRGYTVIAPGSLSGAEWVNVKRFEVALPAGQVTPSPKPYDPNGPPLKLLPDDKITSEVKRVISFAKKLGYAVLEGTHVDVVIANDTRLKHSATYGPGSLTLNVARLGYHWFSNSLDSDAVLTLLIHEYGHHYSGDHLSKEYHNALCLIGARLARAVQKDPSFYTVESD